MLYHITVVYIHGKGGSVEEAKHYQKIFPNVDIVGLDYKSNSPWETGAEIRKALLALKAQGRRIIIIANSIGAFFTMHANVDSIIYRAFWISPIVDMEKLIAQMMTWAGVTEDDLKNRQEIPTAFGETLSWTYLNFVRANKPQWRVPTSILYGARDNLTDFETISAFAANHRASLTVMDDGEHWFHTDAQMAYLDRWMRSELEKWQ